MITPEEVDSIRWFDEVKRISKAFVGFFALACLFHIAALWIPDIKTDDETVRLIWQRGETYDTDWLPVSNMITYTALNGLGFVYVNLILKNRRSGFISINQNRWDFTLLIMILSPLIFYTSTIMTWRSRHAVDKIVCAEDELESCHSYDAWELL